MRFAMGVLMFALCASRAMAACPPLTEANVFISMSGSLYIGDPLTLKVGSFAYDFGCGPHAFRWFFSDAFSGTGREITRILTHPIDVDVYVSNAVSEVQLRKSIQPIGGYEPWPMIVERRSASSFRFWTSWDDVTWDFGDGTTATGRFVEHQYAITPRTYRVTVRSSGGSRYTQEVRVHTTRRRSARH